MKFNVNMLNRSFGRFGGMLKLKAKAKAPDIMFATGALAVAGGTVLACLKMGKVSETVERAKDEINDLKDNYEGNVVVINGEAAEPMDKGEYRKELTKIYAKTAGKVAVQMAPAAALEIGGIALLGKSHGMLKERAASSAAMAAAFKKAYDKLYSEAVERYGKEEADKMRYGVKTVESEEVVGKTEDGKDKVKKTSEDVIFDNPGEYSLYARFFDETCANFNPDNPNYNLKFLLDVQCMMNDKLKKEGYVFLNDVYDALGMAKVFPEGQTHGWLYNNQNSDGDEFIDFGIHNYKRPNRRFVNGYEPVVLLDFNCEGDIVNKIDKGWSIRGGFRTPKQRKYTRAVD